MAINKPRNRVLIFRLSEDEYETLQAASTGARSLSEFARGKLLSSIGEPPETPKIGEQLMDLKVTVERDRGTAGEKLMSKFFWLFLPMIAIAQIRTNLMEETGKANLPSQKLGVDDLVAVSVYDAPELTRTVRVETDGTIHLPLLKNGMPASGIFPGNSRRASPQR